MTDAYGDSAVSLGSGARMPLVGFGTWQAEGKACYDAVRCALAEGYRHLDTATFYRNEDQVGRALRDSGVPREEVFLTTKLPPSKAGEERATIASSLRALGVDYVDLWLIHWPPAGQAAPEVWQELLKIRDDGLAAAVGVSNYHPAQLDELIKTTGEAPAVNQIPWGPTLYDAHLAEETQRRGVVLEGYSPLRNTNLYEPVLVEIANAHGVTAAQVVMRWHVEHGVVVIPKSVTPARIRENIDVFGFRLTTAEIARIDMLAAS